MSKKEILEKLLIDKDEKLEAIVEQIRKVLRIDKESGRIMITASRSSLAERQRIALYLAGKYFANELGLNKDSTVSLKELSEELTLDPKTTSARLSELKREGIVKSPSRGNFEILYFGISIILDEIDSSRGDKKQK